jgi:hypothetical protein
MEKLLAAIRNNAAWCDAVVNTHEGQTRFEASHWINITPSPPFYPNVITLTRDDTAAQLAAIRELDAAQESGWGVKDSFATLDLAPLGFEKLFDAQWLYRPASEIQAPTLPGLDWKKVTAEMRLAAWERGFFDGEEPEGLFRPGLLSDPEIAIMGAFNKDEARAGAIFNRHSGACGISNVFSANDFGDAFLKNVVARAAAFAKGDPLVTYMPHDVLPEWQALGFEPIGPLRVWLKK